MLQQALALAEKKGCFFAVTGHSLGGWLAQLTAFIAQDNQQHRSKIPIKAITFDTPGARPMLEQMNPKNEGIDLEQLDDDVDANPRQYTLVSHAMRNFLNAFEPTTGKEWQCVLAKSWPLISTESFKKQDRGLPSCSVGNFLWVLKVVASEGGAWGSTVAFLSLHSKPIITILTG